MYIVAQFLPHLIELGIRSIEELLFSEYSFPQKSLYSTSKDYFKQIYSKDLIWKIKKFKPLKLSKTFLLLSLIRNDS